MLFPRQADAVPRVAQDYYALRLRVPLGAVRPVSERTLVPLIVPRPGASAFSPASRRIAAYQRSSDARRQSCRRLYSTPVLLDTRSGTDRRGSERRQGEITFNVDLLA